MKENSREIMKALKVTLKILLYVFGGIFILFLIASIAIDPYLKRTLEQRVNEADEGQYTLVLDDLNVSLIRGNIHFSGISFKTDTVNVKDAPVINATATEFNIEGISWLEFLMSDELYLGSVSLKDFSIELMVHSLDDEELPPFKLDHLDIYPMIEEHIDRFHLENLRFNNIDLTLINISRQDTLNFIAETLDLHSEDVLIDANKLFTSARTFYTARLDFEGNDMVIKRSGNLDWYGEFYKVKADIREDEMGLLAEDLNFLMTGELGDSLLFIDLSKMNVASLNLNNLENKGLATLDTILISGLKISNQIIPEIDPDEVADREQDNDLDIATFSFGKNLPDFVDSIKLDLLKLEDIHYSQEGVVHLYNFGLEARNIIIDSTSAFSDNRFFHASTFKMGFDSVHTSAGSPSHHFALHGLDLSIENGIGSILLDGMKANALEKLHAHSWMDAEVLGFGIYHLDSRQLPEKSLAMDSVAIETPIIAFHMGHGDKNASNATNNATQIPDLYPAIEDFLDQIHLRKFALINGDIRVSGMDGNFHGLHIPTLYVQVTDILIEEDNAFSDNRFLHTSDIAVRVENMTFKFPDNVYKLNTNLARLSTSQRFLEINGMTYNYNSDYHKILEAPEENMVFKATNQVFRVDELDYSRLVQQGGLVAGNINISGLDVEIFQDGNMPSEEDDGIQPMPSDMIRDLDIPLFIGTLDLKDSDLKFRQRVEGSDTAGVMYLNNIQVKIENLTNIDLIIENNPETLVSMQGQLFRDDGILETNIIIPLRNEEQKTIIKGRIDSLNLTELNKLVQYIAPVAIASGELHQLRWDIEAGREVAVGEMEVMYENLKIQLSDTDSPDTTGVIKDIGSFLVNALVLDTNIPEHIQEPEKVFIEQERDKEEGFLAYYLQAIMAGFIELWNIPFVD